jgi:hypothetical protein
MRIHLKELPKQIAISFMAKVNSSYASKPALGKTWGVIAAHKLIQQYEPKAKLWMLDMATMSPNDICVYMPDVKSNTLTAYPNAELPNAYTDPDATGILFIDEYGLGDPTTISATQKYINNESIGGKLKKPEGVVVVGATNRLADKSNVRQQPRAWMSRMEQWQAYSTPEYDLKLAEDAEWFPIIVQFFKAFPHLIDNYEEVFEPAANDRVKTTDRAQYAEEGKVGVWANKRSWNRLSDVEYVCARTNAKMHPMRALANLGQAVGQQYVTYRATQEAMLNIDDIIKDPKGVRVPDRMDQQYITLCMLASLVKDTQLSAVDTYIGRIGGDLRVMVINRMAARWRKEGASFNLPKSPQFKAWVKEPEFSDLIMGA